jgi:hypothetical protein
MSREMNKAGSRSVLLEEIEAAEKTAAWVNYRWMRDQVLEMWDLDPAGERGASAYWREELAGFDYMLDASPLVVQRLREHCYHLTGVRSYDYRGHHRHLARPYVEKLASLRSVDRSGLLVPEPVLLGGFGHEIDGALINIDTLKFYECLIALDRIGVLPGLRSGGGQGRVVIEIGAGWGGLAYQLKKLCPKLTYVIVDLPQCFLFSGTYLKTAFPQAPFHIATKGVDDEALEAGRNGFVLVPHFLLSEIQNCRPDLAINTVSFQEMTTGQVRQYVRGLKSVGCPMIYSLNRDRSKHNQELTSVTSILSEFYTLEEIPVLMAAYPTLGWVRPRRKKRRLSKIGTYEYRHLLGRC